MKKQRRYTISVTPDLEEDLEQAWKKKYSTPPPQRDDTGTAQDRIGFPGEQLR